VIIVLNVHAPTKDKIDTKDTFYKELERVFDRFPKYPTKILLGDFNAKVGSVWVHLALRPLIGLLCQSRVIMMMNTLVE
jgi:hypothetical protein